MPQSDGEEKRDESLYRPSVGIALFNDKGMVLIAERLDNPGAWQMPQGGIDEGEDPEVAVFREMEEEIGTRDAHVLGLLPEWLYYEVPAATSQKAWGGKWKGQRQQWIALHFLGTDDDIRLDTHDDPEFSQWKWVPITTLLKYVVPFKQDVYVEVIRCFRHFAEAIPVAIKDGKIESLRFTEGRAEEDDHSADERDF